MYKTSGIGLLFNIVELDYVFGEELLNEVAFLNLLAKGKAIDYEGATAVKFTDVGEHVGNFIEKEIKGGKFKNKKQR